MADFKVETVHLDLPALSGSFGTRLRDAGLPVTPDRSADFARALTMTRPVSRRRLYATAKAIFVADRAEVPAFNRVFAEVFGAGGQPQAPDLADTITGTEPAQSDSRPATQRSRQSPREGDDRRIGSTSAGAQADGDAAESEIDVPLAMASDQEVLQQKSFDALEPHELARLYRLMARLDLSTPSRRTRRYDRSRGGHRADLRRTLRGSLRTGGDPVRLARRQRRVVPRRLVMLCDISGSMEPYARAYLQFLASAARVGPNAEAFVFATRLTRITRALGSRHPDRAIQRAAAAAPDWSSGTRIGDALKEFNDRHGRRGMARGAVVVVISDGWERGDPALVGREMERLSRLAYRIVWVNPRVGASDFEVRAGGMVAALAHCDALVSGHSYEALAEVIDAIGGVASNDLESRDTEEEEPWASATPVPGSSVAMPSGYGPSRGKTTPGWSIGERD
jgi:uncharacterized protein with von Willebrand factor type A (vWA) domain